MMRWRKDIPAFPPSAGEPHAVMGARALVAVRLGRKRIERRPVDRLKSFARLLPILRMTLALRSVTHSLMAALSSCREQNRRSAAAPGRSVRR
jgi:hypothetical protein